MTTVYRSSYVDRSMPWVQEWSSSLRSSSVEPAKSLSSEYESSDSLESCDWALDGIGFSLIGTVGIDLISCIDDDPS